MNRFFLGILSIILGLLLVVWNNSQEFPWIITFVIAISLITVGFLLQLSAFYIAHRDFERDRKKKQAEHEAIVNKAKTLSPEEGIDLLLKNMSE